MSQQTQHATEPQPQPQPQPAKIFHLERGWFSLVTPAGEVTHASHHVWADKAQAFGDLIEAASWYADWGTAEPNGSRLVITFADGERYEYFVWA